MASFFSKSILKPEGSVMAGAATIGLVYGVYQLNVGNVSQAHASEPNHPANETSRKKAGYTSLVLVTGLTLIARDVNIGILGGFTIIAMELSYRHAIMSHPATNKMVPPERGGYQDASDTNVIQYPTASEAMDSGTGTYGY